MGLKLSSFFCLFVLFGLVYAIIFAIGIWFNWSLWLMIGLTIGIILLQYLLGPYIINWLYKINWISYDQFKAQYPYLAAVVDKVVSIRGIKTPRMGIIKDGNPNAFTFGHTKNNARIVITSGILEYLDEKEQQAVLAHELGHVVHNDFILMTLVFAIPLLILTIARWCYYASRGAFQSSDDEGMGAAIGATLIVIAALSYVAYFISYLVSLIISRIREYYADEHAAELTEDPNALSTALVKIAYGLLMQANIEKKSNSRTRALRGLGIFDSRGAEALAVASMSNSKKYSKEAIQASAAWDLFNPWAKYYQLFSTHPLPAKRIMRLNHQCEIYGIKPEIDFSYARKLKEEQAGKSMIDEFLFDLFMKLLPILLFVLLIIATLIWIFGVAGLITIAPNIWTFEFLIFLWGTGLMIIGVGMLIKASFKYKKDFKYERVLELVTNVKVSPIRTVPAIIKGKIVGKGIPGYFLSEDLYFQDETGFMYIDYRSGIPFGDFFFAIARVKKLIGQNVIITGWYRRG
ncbi:MAG: zinc metalloprotease HtpX, partial [Promethearchaeota archaeon]